MSRLYWLQTLDDQGEKKSLEFCLPPTPCSPEAWGEITPASHEGSSVGRCLWVNVLQGHLLITASQAKAEEHWGLIPSLLAFQQRGKCRSRAVPPLPGLGLA